jgi:uncharacterized protein
VDYLSQYSIPIKGLGIGLHEMDFVVEDEFFKKFENSVLDNGRFNVKLYLQKKHDHSELDFVIEGVSTQVCDRCLSDVDIPIIGDYRIYLKIGEDVVDDEDIIFMSPAESQINIAKILFEIIAVLMPLKKVCEEVDGQACNQDVLDALEDEEDENTSDSSAWDALKQMKFED